MRLKMAGTAIVVFCAASGTFAQFIPGNLIVSRMGDGVQNLSGTGNSIFLDQYSTSGGTRISSLALPDTGAGAIIANGNGTTEGALTLSADGRYLTYAGYGRSITNNNLTLTTSSSATVPRVVARIDSLGNVDTTTRLTDAFSGAQFRSAVTNDGTSFYLTGGNDGIRYANVGSATSTVITPAINNSERIVNIFNGNLYFSEGGSTAGIYQIGTGLPTATGTAATRIAATGTSTSPYDFFLTSDALTLYVGDDSNSTAAGLRKYTRTSSSGSFSLAYNLNKDLVNIGLRSIAVDTTTAGGPTIYGITGANTFSNRLVSIKDTGADAIFTTLATPSANTVFRGVAFAPSAVAADTPEPGTLALLFTGAVPSGIAAVRRKRAKKQTAA